MSTKANTKEVVETVNDGTIVLVASRKTGEMREVKVKKLSVLRMANLARAVAAPSPEMAEVVLYTGLSEAQVEELTDESQLELQTEGRRLNFPQLGGYYKRARVLNEAIIGKEDGGEMEKAAEILLKAQE